jgi:hypothetical protein
VNTMRVESQSIIPVTRVQRRYRRVDRVKNGPRLAAQSLSLLISTTLAGVNLSLCVSSLCYWAWMIEWIAYVWEDIIENAEIKARLHEVRGVRPDLVVSKGVATTQRSEDPQLLYWYIVDTCSATARGQPASRYGSLIFSKCVLSTESHSTLCYLIAHVHVEGPESEAYKLQMETRQDFMWTGAESMMMTGTNGSWL